MRTVNCFKTRFDGEHILFIYFKEPFLTVVWVKQTFVIIVWDFILDLRSVKCIFLWIILSSMNLVFLCSKSLRWTLNQRPYKLYTSLVSAMFNWYPLQLWIWVPTPPRNPTPWRTINPHPSFRYPRAFSSFVSVGILKKICRVLKIKCKN